MISFNKIYVWYASLFHQYADNRSYTTICPNNFYFPASNTTITFRENELSNVEIIVADISKFEMERSFDRIVSIEMFEV